MIIESTDENIKTLQRRLAMLSANVYLTAPHNVAYDLRDFPEWSLYDFAFTDYMNIGGADCQIVCNETPHSKGFINNLMAREVLCGIYKQKAIVMLHAPAFDSDVDEYSKALIGAKLDKIYICNLLVLDAADVKNFVCDVSRKTINYGLTNYDLGKIKNQIRHHLRALQRT